MKLKGLQQQQQQQQQHQQPNFRVKTELKMITIKQKSTSAVTDFKLEFLIQISTGNPKPEVERSRTEKCPTNLEMI